MDSSTLCVEPTSTWTRLCCVRWTRPTVTKSSNVPRDQQLARAITSRRTAPVRRETVGRAPPRQCNSDITARCCSTRGQKVAPRNGRS